MAKSPEQVLESIVHGINTGNLEALMPLYEPEAYGSWRLVIDNPWGTD